MARDIVMIGAGMCGLMAALAAPELSRRILIIDKGRSVGGRMATRRVSEGRADHGAQFFSVRTSEFADWVEEWRIAGWVFEWATHWSDGSIDTQAPRGFVRFAAVDGMNALAKRLAEQAMRVGVDIRVGTRVTALEAQNSAWRIRLEDDTAITADLVVATAPVPQTLELLAAGQAALPPAQAAALANISYAPCLCLLVTVGAEVNLPHPGARQTPDATVSWIADNQRKGISPGARVLTLHANPTFSAAHYTTDDATLQRILLDDVADVIGAAPVLATELKRWRYALPTSIHPEPYLAAETPAPILFGGDAFAGPRIEGAALSGLAIAASLRARLGHN